jgi:hypothetical protein
MLQEEEEDEGLVSGRTLLKENPHTLTTVSYSATSLNSDSTEERTEVPHIAVNHRQDYTPAANNRGAVDRSRRRSIG